MKRFTFPARAIVAFFTFAVLLCPASQAAFFNDVPPESEHFFAINALRESGIANGFSDGTFRPQLPVNRVEILKLVLKVSGFEPEGVPSANPFPDVPRLAWFAPVVQKAKDLWVVSGDGSGNFHPERTVNLAEILKMLCAVNGIETAESLSASPFGTVASDQWFSPFFAFAEENEILSGFAPGQIDPARMLTRGESARIVHNFEEHKQNLHPDVGLASFYADMFNGQTTAGGEIFDQEKFTAAHQTFSFGDRVQVQNLENLSAVVVQINDRGPFSESRIIDLSRKSFQTIAPLSTGVVQVALMKMPADTPLGRTTKSSCNFQLNFDKKIPKDFFTGITLEKDLPTHFRKGEVLEIRGTLQDSQEQAVTAFLGAENFSSKVTGGKFTLRLTFPQVGDFDLAIIPGTSGESTVQSVRVFQPVCEPTFENASGSWPHNFQVQVFDGQTHLSWDDEWNQLFLLRFSQGENVLDFFVNGSCRLVVEEEIFRDFSAGAARLEIFGAPLANEFSASQTKGFHRGVNQQIHLLPHESKFGEFDKIANLQLVEQFSHHGKIEISGQTQEEIESEALVILPGGEIASSRLQLDEHGNFAFSFQATQVGTHIVEINAKKGGAILNVPIFQRGFVPVLPGFWDLPENVQEQENVTLGQNREEFLNLTNEKRAAAGLNLLALDENFNTLAQFRTKEMIEKNYLSHFDEHGKTVNDFRAHHAVKVALSENIAQEANLPAAFQGLWRSAAHRQNILGDNFTRMGFGIAKRESGEIVVVQLFGGDAFELAKVDFYREQFLGALNAARANPVIPNVTLDAIAQNWTEKMIAEIFFAFEHEGESLESNLQNAGITAKTSALIFQENSVRDFLGLAGSAQISGQANQLLESDWQKIGLGILADEVGNLFAVVVVSQ